MNNGAYAAPSSNAYPEEYSSQRRFSAGSDSSAESFNALRPSSLAPTLLQRKYGGPQTTTTERPTMPSFQNLVSSASRLLQEETFADRVADGRKRKYLSPPTTSVHPSRMPLSPHPSARAALAARDPLRDTLLIEQFKKKSEGETDDLLELMYGVRGERLISLKRALMRGL